MKKLLLSICFIFVLTITACASGKLADGEYKVNITLEGGSGRASLTSPTDMIVKDGVAYARLEWSSPNYDYMIVDGKKYLPVNEEGNSVFEVPIITFDEPMDVVADTTAMSTPHEIEYKITFGQESVEKQSNEKLSNKTDFEIPEKLGDDLVWKEKMEVEYATGFSVDYYENENNKAIYKLLTIYDDGQYLICPNDKEEIKNISEDIKAIASPKQIYLVASQVMDMFVSMDALDTISYLALEEKDWYIDEAKDLLSKGAAKYAGKYSAPDYEFIVNGGCDLAIENTMIYHSPEVKEKLESFNIPVIVDRSSYEKEPLGRVEWVKLYSAIAGKEEIAKERFDSQVSEYKNIIVDDSKDKPTIAFFYISSNGTVKVRSSSDYLPKMIDMAGGEYIFSDIGSDDDSASTMSLQMEQFYATAKDADYIIYNSTIDGELDSVSDLIAKNELLSNMKAVKENKVYCTAANLYQSSMELGTIIKDMNKMISGESDMTYIYKLD